MIEQNPKELVSRLADDIHQQLAPFVDKDKPVAVVDFPDHQNVGDSAIWLGEMKWLKDHFDLEPTYVSRGRDFSSQDLDSSMPEGPIFINGGGNFGDIWEHLLVYKETVLEACPDRKIVQFPQSIHYNSLERAEKTARIIERHKDFTLFVRDEKSKDFAEKHFQCNVHLCPDMAFCIGSLEKRPTQFPILAMLREDKEGADIGTWNFPDIPREDWITENRQKVRLAKLKGALSAGLSSPAHRKFKLFDAAARQRFERGIGQISRGDITITDRLHVHICLTLLGKQHAVLDNSYGKIQRLMDTFYPEGTGITERPDSLEQAVEWARSTAFVITRSE